MHLEFNTARFITDREGFLAEFGRKLDELLRGSVSGVVRMDLSHGPAVEPQELDEGMNIYAPPGTKVVFRGRGGYPPELEEAKAFLKAGEVYTVRRTIVGRSETKVYLEGFEKPFNSVQFIEEARCPSMR